MTELTPENQEVSMEGGIYMTEQEKNRTDLFSLISQKLFHKPKLLNSSVFQFGMSNDYMPFIEK